MRQSHFIYNSIFQHERLPMIKFRSRLFLHSSFPYSTSVKSSPTFFRLSIPPSIKNKQSPSHPPPSRQTSPKWNDWSLPWKQKTTTQRASYLVYSTLHLSLIGGGLSLIGYILINLFSQSTEEAEAWSVFESVRDRMREDPRIQQILGSEIIAYPQDSDNSRIRNTLGYVYSHEPSGERLVMNFFVQGRLGKGIVYVERFKELDSREAKDVLIYMDHLGTGRRIILAEGQTPRKRSGFFGINWTRK